MNKDIEKIVVVPQFELEEDSINEIVENVKNEHIDELISYFEFDSMADNQEVDDEVKEVIGSIFGFGVKAGIYEILSTINDAALMSGEGFNESEFSNKSTEPIS